MHGVETERKKHAQARSGARHSASTLCVVCTEMPALGMHRDQRLKMATR